MSTGIHRGQTTPEAKQSSPSSLMVVVVGGGGGILGLISAWYVPLVSQNPYPIIVYNVAKR